MPSDDYVNDIMSDNFDNGCFMFEDSTLLVNNSMFNNNNGKSIMSLSRSDESYYSGNMISTQLSINNIAVNDGIGNSFLFLYNLTDGDYLNVTNSGFESKYYEYILYMTSSH